MSSIGTELKINVSIEPIDGTHMSDYDFICRFYIYTNRYVDVKKSEMIKLDNDNYVALVDSTAIGVGQIKMQVTAFIPDADFADDGVRTEIETVNTGIKVSC